MKEPDRPLCKLKKDQLTALLPELAKEIATSRFLCRKCARAAPSKTMLCKPVRLDHLTKP